MKTLIRAALKPAVSSVLLTGIYLHLSRVVFGPQLVLAAMLIFVLRLRWRGETGAGHCRRVEIYL